MDEDSDWRMGTRWISTSERFIESRLPSESFGIGRRVRDIPSILTVIEDMFSSVEMFITTCFSTTPFNQLWIKLSRGVW